MGAYKWILREGDEAEHFNRIVEKKAMEMLEEDFIDAFRVVARELFFESKFMRDVLWKIIARPNAVTSCNTVVAVTMQIAGNAHSKTATLCTTAAGVTRPSARIAHSRTATACTTALGVTWPRARIAHSRTATNPTFLIIYATLNS